MGEVFLEYAKELFRQGKLKEAHETARFVFSNDPHCPGVRPLLAIYAALLNRNSDILRINCYSVLGVSSSASDQQIAHRFCSIKKLVALARSPFPVVDRFSTAAAAEEANSLLNYAFQVLSDQKSRSHFDASWNVKPAAATAIPLADKKKKLLPLTPPLADKKKPQSPLAERKKPQPQPPLAERKKPQPQVAERKKPQPPVAERKKPQPPVAERKKPRVLPPRPEPLAEKRKRELTAPPLAEKKKPLQLTTPAPPAPVDGKRKREIILNVPESKKPSKSEKQPIKRIRVVMSEETWRGY
ncbi:hypothetical protein LINPERPRIM_LOCUS26566 [Linum perenne]